MPSLEEIKGDFKENNGAGDAMWLLGNDSRRSAGAGRGLITIKSRFMALLNHSVNELAGLESQDFLEWNCVPIMSFAGFYLKNSSGKR